MFIQLNRIHLVEFVLKSEENPFLRQILCKKKFPTWYQTFVVFSKDWINHSDEYKAISGVQNLTPKGPLEQSSFTADSYKIFVKRFHFLCFLKVPCVTIFNKSNRNEGCRVIYSITKYRSTFLHRIILALSAH